MKENINSLDSFELVVRLSVLNNQSLSRLVLHSFLGKSTRIKYLMYHYVLKTLKNTNTVDLVLSFVQRYFK